MKQGYLAVLADATRDETLRDVGIDRALGLVAALGTDADNLYTTLSAKQLNTRILIASRVNEEEAERKLRRAGADTIFAPYYFTGYRLAQALVRPHVTQFLDFTTQGMGVDIAIEQVQVSHGSGYDGVTIEDVRERNRDLGVSMLAIRRAGGRMVMNPSPVERIEGGDYLIVMGQPEALRKLESALAAQAS